MKMNTTQSRFLILSRDGYGTGHRRGYAIWERSDGGALIYRGEAKSRKEAEQRIRTGRLVHKTIDIAGS